MIFLRNSSNHVNRYILRPIILKFKILVVDNNPVIIKLMFEYLSTQNGHEVQTAGDGLSALECLNNFTPDIIFIDLIMPNISGDKLSRIIRQMPKLNNTFLVMISAFAAENQLTPLDLGVNACIVKGPFKDVSTNINHVLESYARGETDEFSSKTLGIENYIPRANTAELLYTKQHFENVLENISDGILELDQGTGKIIFANRIAHEIVGFSVDSLLSVELISLFSESEKIRINKILDSPSQAIHLGENNPFRINKRLVSINIIPAEDKKGPYVLIVLRDITSRKIAENKIKESELGYRSFAKIGQALSAEKNIKLLLEMIVDEARFLSKADAGTLYTVDPKKQELSFAILQNETMGTRLGGPESEDITFPSIPLYKQNKPNHTNVSSHVALTGEIVNIPDVYEAKDFDFTGPREYDKVSGYRSQSMLVLPLQNHENEIIGVLQLLNAHDTETDDVIPFSKGCIGLVASLASQAAIALTNVSLVKDLQSLLHAFIKSIATAIDEKSPYTGGHIRRVNKLAMMLARMISDSDEAPFAEINFSDDEFKELGLASWMHDVGKITTPEHVVDKEDKLQTIFKRILLIETRFKLIAQYLENQFLKQKIKLLNSGCDTSEITLLDEQLSCEKINLAEDFKFIKACNKGSEFMNDTMIEKLQAIANKTFIDNDKEQNYLTDNELTNLCVRKGTLTGDERMVIENHAMMTWKILMQIPFPSNMAHVPEYAAWHHEKLDGTGYPFGLEAEDLPMQARIMAVADIFEALTAKDRPYREPMKLSQALKIMGFMKKDQHIDANIFDLFIQKKLHLDYAHKEMNPDQIDV